MEQSADYWRGAGERIETLLQANAGAGPGGERSRRATGA
ncbi:hypothetical protein G9444_2808 [Rhodococcus erythropolis]|uniref:Uncharacterized protein n=1 Tax=Rhodococcus erythropolis TaxID=1833 RepID=A0A6G9CT76_RHOER|nr:hypothetical protein G9444_2808 [Rhodococcus erythropolis]